MDSWSTDDGLPQNSIISIAQTPDGYLWLATFAGVVRFDGLRFTVFDAGNTPELVSSRIVNLKVDRHGALWIRSEYGDIARLAGGRFTHFTAADGLPARVGVAVFTEDQAGNFWVPGISDQGILRLEGEKFVVRVPPVPAMSRGYQTLIPTRDGSIWGTGGNILTKLWPGEVVDYVFDAERPEALVKLSDLDLTRSLQITFLEPSRDGGIWVANVDGLRKFRDGRWQEFRPAHGPLASVANVYEDRAGNLWVGTWDDGLWQFDVKGEVHKHKLTDSPAHEPVRSIFEDREGNLWVGTLGAGLFRVKPRLFTIYGIKDGLAGKVVRSITRGADGTVWMLNSDQINWLQEQTQPRVQRVQSDISWASCNLVGRDGTAWVGTLRNGLFRYRKGEWFHYPFERSVLNLFEDRGGVLWLGADHLLARVEGDAIRKIPSPDGGQLDVNAMADDSLGGLYLGLNGAGLLRYSRGEWTRFSKSDGLPDERVWSLYVDAENTVWMGGYDRGLARLKAGKIFSFSAPGLRLPGFIGSILEDNYGTLWLTSNHGIHTVSKKELNDFADGTSDAINTIRYTQRDGLATSECASSTQPVSFKGSDGRLWFATMSGVAVVDPSTLPHNTVPPPVAIEEVLIDDAETTKRDGLVTVPPGKHRIEIRFTALSLTAPEKLRFKYQLESFDPGWVDAGTQRVAHYTAVAPGRYRFRVQGCNNDGVWSETSANLAIAVVPYYWQTGWFIGLALASLLGVGVAGYHRRITTLKRERLAQAEFSRRLIESQELERKRISAELHDGLGQSLLLIRNRAVMGREQVVSSAGDTAPLDAISEAALSAINEVRSIAYDLRPYELDRLGLTKAIESVVERAANAAGFRTELEIELIDDLLPPEFEINLYRIAQEAVTNAVKYARAQTLMLSLKAEGDALHLVIRDDGCGMANLNGMPGPSRKGGLGMVGISERAKIMSGQATFVSAPGQGTTLTVVIPLANYGRN